VAVERPLDTNGLITGIVKTYYETGQLESTAELKDNRLQGVMKEFDINGKQMSEFIFENDSIIKSYSFENGIKIIPVTDDLELVAYKTGFYKYVDLNNYQILFQPIVIMKWKNISNVPFSKKMEIRGIFINNKTSEEWDTSHAYFQSSLDSPLQPGISRQTNVKSNTGYTSSWSIDEADISCDIYINDQFYKSIKIKNDYLTSNRI
jgi:hypothetical protein